MPGMAAALRERFCESGEGVRLPRERGWPPGKSGNFRGSLGNFRGSLGNFRGTSGLLLSSTVREPPGKSPKNFRGSLGNFRGSPGTSQKLGGAWLPPSDSPNLSPMHRTNPSHAHGARRRSMQGGSRSTFSQFQMGPLFPPGADHPQPLPPVQVGGIEDGSILQNSFWCCADFLLPIISPAQPQNRATYKPSGHPGSRLKCTCASGLEPRSWMATLFGTPGSLRRSVGAHGWGQAKTIYSCWPKYCIFVSSLPPGRGDM